jgi:hypothetical protein
MQHGIQIKNGYTAKHKCLFLQILTNKTLHAARA